MNKLKSLTIFYPVYNDSKIIPYLIAKAYSIAPRITKNFEIIAVNDGSTDESGTILKILKQVYRNLIIINHEKNLGYGATLRSGFNNATKEWVFYTDGDGQFDPFELTKLVNKIRPNIDVVNGYKKNRADNYIRRLIGSIYNKIIHLFYKLPISDLDCDFRLIRRSCLRKIKFSSTSGLICLELILKLKRAGAKFAEVPVKHYPRIYGQSQFFRPKHLLTSLKEHLHFRLNNH